MFLLYQFIRYRYNTVETVFVSHTTEAQEVSEDDFFQKASSGGTYISSGLLKTIHWYIDNYEWLEKIKSEKYNMKRLGKVN